MRIMKGKSKDPTYHVIQDVRRNGKRSTEIIENLGHASEICSKYNVSDADAWAGESPTLNHSKRLSDVLDFNIR